MLACRACRVPMAASEGCAVCNSMRANLVAVDEDEAERPSLSDVSHEVIANLRRLNKRAGDLLKDPTKPKLFVEGAKLAIAAGNTAAKVIESARKLQTDGMSSIRNMSFIERAQLFVDWYLSLPPTYRMKVREAQDKHEGQLSRALPEKSDATATII